MLSISLSSNIKSVMLEFQANATEQVQATVRALNKTADQAKVQASRMVRDAGYQLKISDIKAAMRIKRANGDRLSVSIVTNGRPVPLIKYGARQTSKGVSVNVLNGRKVIKEAFIATGPGGRMGVFLREPGGQHVKVIKNGKPSWHQLPIKELFGPSIPQAVMSEKVQAALQEFIVEKFPVILRQETKWATSKGR